MNTFFNLLGKFCINLKREREREREFEKKKLILIVKELYFHFMSSNMCKSNAHYVNIDL